MPSKLIITDAEIKLGDSDSKITIRIPKFELRQNEIVAVIGSNGCGKSTLLDMIAMLYKPDEIGEFNYTFRNDEYSHVEQLDNEEISKIRRNNIAYILQNGGLLEFLTLKQNISLVKKLKKGKQANFDQVISELGIGTYINKKPMELSGGQRQKGAIARALIQEPDIILADEPTSAMDTISAINLMTSLTNRVKCSDSSLIIVSHDLSLVNDYANRVYRFCVSQVNGETLSVLNEEACHRG
ncbi:hypothetical protein CS022_13605 [Veronia nyctiphanis]|uniref:Putative hemin import ATP-binding protein HrtA n=1 Tax=Veronia nyctiphanis TaxID=1278244 RepID=A0A4V1LSU1_9GAMM|nr:ABC transporter ATP-binding protein [Veronia nyctiphanis]RXJ72878.1 hypothetical protein CS022_13605 [Veronia nyctiphanis]